jgi:acyl dehydratase
VSRLFTTYDDLAAATGDHLGYSDWLTVDQERIDTFAAATGDRQWIHVDPQRAAQGPFGMTVAHGYLTLSLVPALLSEVVEYAGWSLRINYGTNKVRFPQPVAVNSRVRAGLQLIDVAPVSAGTQVTSRVTLEVQDPRGDVLSKPALVAETVTLLA